MKVLSAIFLSLFFAHLAFAAGGTVAPAEAWNMIRQGAAVIDVRTAEEYSNGHLKRAKNVPLSDLPAGITPLKIDKEAPIVLYCKSGRRAALAQQALQTSGYTQVVNAGGYEALKKARPPKG